MRDPRAARTSRPYWLFIPLVGLLLAPTPWLLGACIATVAGSIVVASVARRHLARRGGGREGAHRRAGEPGAAVSSRLGTDTRGRTIAVDDEQLAAHGLILGASGTGKSTTLLALLCDHVRRGRPVVALDMKGSPDFARRLGDAADAAGRRFVLWTPDGPSFWNPLAHGNPTELKDKLVATEHFSEPHYQRAAERYLQTVFTVLGEVHPGWATTLDEVVRAMDPGRLAILARRAPPERRERVHGYFAALTPDQLSAVRGLATRLAIISESHTGRYLEPPTAGAGSAGHASASNRRQAVAGPLGALDRGPGLARDAGAADPGPALARHGALSTLARRWWGTPALSTLARRWWGTPALSTLARRWWGTPALSTFARRSPAATSCCSASTPARTASSRHRSAVSSFST